MKLDENFTICDIRSVHVVLENIFTLIWNIIWQRPNMHVVIVDIDGNPKPLPVTRLAGVD